MEKLTKFWTTLKQYFKIAFSFSKKSVIVAVEKIDWSNEELQKLRDIINQKINQ